MRYPDDPIERFVNNIRCLDGHWFWKGASTDYGRMRIAGLVIKAHRFAYETFVGPIPDEHVIHHTCGEKFCVNPEHLKAVPKTCHQQEHSEHGNKVSQRRQEQNPPKTCRRGHAFSEKNTYVRPDGSYACRVCSAARARQRYRGVQRHERPKHQESRAHEPA